MTPLSGFERTEITKARGLGIVRIAQAFVDHIGDGLWDASLLMGSLLVLSIQDYFGTPFHLLLICSNSRLSVLVLLSFIIVSF